jgi:hypothetical protein
VLRSFSLHPAESTGWIVIKQANGKQVSSYRSMSSEERYCQFYLMPVQFKQIISSFLTQSVYKELAVSAAWHVLPKHLYLLSRTDENYFDLDNTIPYLFINFAVKMYRSCLKHKSPSLHKSLITSRHLSGFHFIQRNLSNYAQF